MRNLTIKKIIEFRMKSDKSKQKFATDLKLNIEEKNTKGGGDYWIICLSAISNSFKLNDLQNIKDKIYELEGKIENTEFQTSKIMYQKNIAILYDYEDFDFIKLRPSKKISFIKKNNTNSVITIKGLQIKVTPHHVFSFKKNGVEEVGAIWFIAKLGGYRKEELGMFTDILFRYLKNNFSKKFNLNPKYCIAVDVVNNFDVNYSQIQNTEVPAILIKTINEIKRIM